MVIRLSASHKNTQGLESNSIAEPAATYEWSRQVVLDKATQIFHQQLGRFDEAIHQ
jgi:hypothetical protein